MRSPLRLPVLILLGLCGLAPAAEPKRDRSGEPLPDGAVARLGDLRLRTEQPILAAVFTAGGKQLAGAAGNSLTFWDTLTAKEVRRFSPRAAGQMFQLRHLCADARTLVYSRFDKPNVLSFVDADSGKEQHTLNHAQCGFIHALDTSRDGTIVAASHQASIALWDVANDKLLHELKGPPITPLSAYGRLIALTPDGKQLVLPHSDGSLHLLDVASGKELRAFEMPPARPGFPASLRVQYLALSPDGRRLAFCGPATPLTVCELSTGKRLREMSATQGVISGLAFTPNGRFLAVADYMRIRLFGLLSGKELCTLPPATGNKRLVFSPDGRTLAVVGDFTVSLWDMADQRMLHSPTGHEAPVRALAFFPDGKRLVSTDNTMNKIVWDVASGRPLAQRKDNLQIMSLAVEADGETVRYTSYDAAVHRWRPGADREERQPVATTGGLSMNVLALSPDSRSLVAISSDRQLRLYDLKTGKSTTLPGLTRDSWVLEVAFAPDSRRLAACSGNGEIGLWDRDTGKLLRRLKKEGVGGNPMLAFASDGRSLCFFDGMIRVREIASGADRVQIAPTPGAFYALAYSPDNQLLACGQPGSVAVYSADSGHRLAELHGNQGDVHALAFSPDGRLLASAGSNGTILVWQVPQEKFLPVTAKKAASLWQELGALDAAVASRALFALAAFPEQTLPLLKEHLQPLGNPPSHDRLRRRIAELDDESFEIRERATRELRGAGNDAGDLLREALQSGPSFESKRRIESLLARLEKGDSRRLRFLRGVEVLERIGTPAAKELLGQLADKPMPEDLREEVRASVRRMEQHRRLTAEDPEKRRGKTTEEQR